MEKEFNELCRRIEVMMGRKMKTPKDFYFLSEAIWMHLHENISCSTLMRIWGYAGKTAETRYSTKSILSRMLGYSDWDGFLAEYSSKESNRSLSLVRARTLTQGQMIEVCWEPKCRCVFLYEGEMRFRVVEAENSHLFVDDSFYYGIFLLEEPLLLNTVVHEGMQPIHYIVASKSGVTSLRIL